MSTVHEVDATRTGRSRGGQYRADDIQLLEGLDAVRRVPGMYIGGVDQKGLQHLVWELFDNAVDEALAGWCRDISVTYHSDGSVEVSDDGRGIPVDTHPDTGLTGVETVLTRLHAGGKFGRGHGPYSRSGGLHGVGASVVNALSERLDVTVRRDGRVWRMSFRRGEPGEWDGMEFTPRPGLRRGEAASGTGTSIRFWPDPDVFPVRYTEDSYFQTLERARVVAALVEGLSVTVEGWGRRQTVECPGGVADLVETGDAILGPVTAAGDREADGQRIHVTLAVAWDDTEQSSILGYVNTIPTPAGGSHLQAFERAVTKLVSEHTPAGAPALSKEDVFEGLRAVVAVSMPDPGFEGQTKAALSSPAAYRAVLDVASTELAGQLLRRGNRAAFRRVVSKAVEAAGLRLRLRHQRDVARKRNAVVSARLPAKLAGCRTTRRDLAELFIVEGDSAMGTAKAARDAATQALLPLRGKVLNAWRAGERQVLDNPELAAVVSALGTGTGKACDPGKARYGKAIILTDADADGAHIRCLLLAFFWAWMRPLVLKGMVHVAEPPLYRVDYGDEWVYADTDEELDLFARKRRPKAVQRFKGLGEMSPGQLLETAMDPETRRIRQVTVSDAEEASRLFDQLMGDSPQDRWRHIVSRAAFLDPELVDD